MSSIVLTTPVSSTGSVPGVSNSNIVIPSTPPNNVVVVDSVPTSAATTVKWIYTIRSIALNYVLSGEVLGLHRNNSNPTHTRYAIIGDTDLFHKVDVKIQNNNLELEITNLSEQHTDVNKHVEYLINIIRIQSY